MITKILQKLRSNIFWMIDFLQGNLVKNAYHEIKRIDNMSSNDKELINYKNIKFQKLAHHASTTTKFYKKYSEGTSWHDFPIINKNMIKKSQDDFLSDAFEKKQLFQMSTSGSTGTPFVSYQNVAKKRRVNAEIIYYSECAGYEVGKNLIYLRVITEKINKTRLKQFIQNQYLIDIGNLGNNRLEEVAFEIFQRSKNGSTLLAYASTYDALKDYIEKHGVGTLREAKVSGAVSGAEMLYDNTRNTIEKALKTRLYSRYSNQENGVIGQDYEQNNIFIINEANYIVEIFDLEEDKLVPNGTVGRIVITDLYNYAMPMIRYDTGDVGAITTIDYKGVRKNAITNFGGRKVDMIYDYNGNRISPHSLTNNLWSFTTVKQFQFIQENEREYRFKYNSAGNKIDQDALLKVLHQIVGEAAVIHLEKIEGIPVLASGKRKMIVNNIKN